MLSDMFVLSGSLGNGGLVGRRPPGSQQNTGSNPMGDVNPARVVRGGQFG